MRKIKKIGIGITCLAVVSLSLLGAAQHSDIYFLIKKNFTIFSEVYREVSLNYVDEVDPEKLMRKGLNFMLEGLDPYIVFIDEGNKEDINILSRGSYGGIGLEVGVKGDQMVVVAPLEGYPAYRNGIRSGDIIKAVDGVPVQALSPDEVRNMTVGEPDSPVTIRIQRFGAEQELTFELVRKRIEVKSITYQGLVGEEEEIGYIQLNRFSKNASDEVQEALLELNSQRELRGLILDLRNNPGGLLGEAVGVVDKFVNPGLTVVETRGRLKKHNSSFSTREVPLADDLPLVILQNEGSASASEIVAGALQDYDRAVIVGEQSFGKGLVQVVRPLSYNTALKITISRYYIPSGRSIQSVTYTHDNKNRIIDRPDSLRKKFKTRNGRTVYDSDGIAPDIPVSSSPPSLLETSLMQHGHFFHFANQYASRHEEFTAGGVSDSLFDLFRHYLEKEQFEFKTTTEQYLDSVGRKISTGSFSGDAVNHLEALEKAIDRDKQQNFIEQKEQLKKNLYMELVSRYRGSRGQTRASLDYDVMLEKAIGILDTPEKYNRILSGK